MKVIAQIAKGDEFEYMICKIAWKVKDIDALFPIIQKTLADGEFVVDIIEHPREMTFHALKKSKHLTKLFNNAAIIFEIPKSKLLERAHVPGNRQRKYAYPRYICWYIMRNRYGMGWSKIGQYFGKRDHATIINGVNKYMDIAKEPQSEKEEHYLALCRQLIDTTLYDGKAQIECIDDISQPQTV